MEAAFADSFYWIAFIDPSDQWHELVRVRVDEVRPQRLTTTVAVIIEVMNHFSEAGSYWRERASTYIDGLFQNDRVQVIPLEEDLLSAGMALYRARPDKGYSLTDCFSMVTMRRLGIRHVLTRDHHFSQEGFDLLL